VQQNNPAACLHRLLEALCKMPDGDSGRKCFSQLLMVPETEPVRLLKRISGMAELVEDIERRVRAVPNLESELYLRWKPSVVKAFGVLSLAAPLKGFADHFKGGNSMVFERLQVCSDLLKRQGDETEIDGPKLHELKIEILNLAKEVVASDIDPELKLFLQYQLGVLADAIDEYHLFGRGPMEKAANNSIGALMTSQKAVRRMAAHPLGEKFWGILGRYTALIVAGNYTIKLMEHVRKLLPFP
jgi:hypothetical protein